MCLLTERLPRNMPQRRPLGLVLRSDWLLCEITVGPMTRTAATAHHAAMHLFLQVHQSLVDNLGLVSHEGGAVPPVLPPLSGASGGLRHDEQPRNLCVAHVPFRGCSGWGIPARWSLGMVHLLVW